MATLSQSNISYEGYLKIQGLLSQQVLLTTAHDELFFIIMHQTYELWFKEILHELFEVIRCFKSLEIQRSIKVLHRIISIQKILLSKLDLLETLTTTEFATFRDSLRPASGFQSVQFREIEFLSGLKNTYFIELFESLPDSQNRLVNYLHQPTLYDHFFQLLDKRGFYIPPEVLERDFSQPYEQHNDVLATLDCIYKNVDEYHSLYLLCESLLSYDLNFGLWRYRHTKMVERMIGRQPGTGGSAGAQYLALTIEKHFFPELWEVRNLI